MNPDRDRERRTENTLSIWILEAKGIPSKRRYFCELCLDKSLYARTSTKPKADTCCFWGEQYEFGPIPAIEDICVNLYREADPKKKRDRCTLIGYVQIKIDQLVARQPVERCELLYHYEEPNIKNHIHQQQQQSSSVSSRLLRGILRMGRNGKFIKTHTPWGSLYCRYVVSENVIGSTKSNGSKNSNGEAPAIRVKARYQTVEVLPLAVYNLLLSTLRSSYLPLCLTLEPVLGVKAKEDLATTLVRILHTQRLAKDFLCDLIMHEVDALENESLMFRGNSLATKAMEAYMKLMAADYLQATLGDYVKHALEAPENCEVDPLKLANPSSALLERNRQNLITEVWRRILDSVKLFPQQLRHVFDAVRRRLEESGRGDLANNLISSSIFLRFLCPAILSPSLFNLVSEYPSGQAARNFTLIAKTLQTLANFTKFGSKEAYMESMNDFIGAEWSSMQLFLQQISTTRDGGGGPTPVSTSSTKRHHTTASDEDIDYEIDLGKELSLCHSYLQDSWTAQLQDSVKRDPIVAATGLGDLWGIIVNISTYSLAGFYNGEGGSNNGSSSSDAINNPPSDYENNVLSTTSATAINGKHAATSNSKYTASKFDSQVATRQKHQPSSSYTTKATQGAARNLNTSDDYVSSSVLPTLNDTLAMRQPANTNHHQRYHRLQQQQQPMKPPRTSILPQPPQYRHSAVSTQQQQQPLSSSREFYPIYDDTPHEFIHPRLYDEVYNGGGNASRLLQPSLLKQQPPPDDSDSTDEQQGAPTTTPTATPFKYQLPVRKAAKKKSSLPANFIASTITDLITPSHTTAQPPPPPQVPSSGYQSQNHSSYSSNSSSPIEGDPFHNQQQQRSGGGVTATARPTTTTNSIPSTFSDLLRMSGAAINIATPMLYSPSSIPVSTPGTSASATYPPSTAPPLGLTQHKIPNNIGRIAKEFTKGEHEGAPPAYSPPSPPNNGCDYYRPLAGSISTRSPTSTLNSTTYSSAESNSGGGSGGRPRTNPRWAMQMTTAPSPVQRTLVPTSNNNTNKDDSDCPTLAELAISGGEDAVTSVAGDNSANEAESLIVLQQKQQIEKLMRENEALKRALVERESSDTLSTTANGRSSHDK